MKKNNRYRMDSGWIVSIFFQKTATAVFLFSCFSCSGAGNSIKGSNNDTSDQGTDQPEDTGTGSDSVADSGFSDTEDTGQNKDTGSTDSADSDSEPQDTEGAKPFIDGFFVQPSLGYGATDYDSFNSQKEYSDWVASMADAGARMLFYQWTVHFWHDQTWFSDAYGPPSSADFAFYDAALSPIDGITARGWVTPTSWPGSPLEGGSEPVEYLLDAGEEEGVEIWLGLYLGEDDNGFNWWNAVSDSELDEQDIEIIDYHVERSIAVVDELYDKYGNHPALGGFYYPVEIANLAFVPVSNWTKLAELLDRVADAVHRNDERMELAISPFFNTELAGPKEFGAMWEYALMNSDLDIVILQDGAGVDPFVLDDSTDLVSPYFEAMKKAVDKAGKRLFGNVELFYNLGTRMEPDFVPSSVERIERQLVTEARYVEKFVCFGFHYMDPFDEYTFTPPLGGDPQEDAALRQSLYDDYMEYSLSR